MIDLANYKRAIQWLKRGTDEHSRQPESNIVRYALWQCVTVTYNVTERTLREALVELSDDPLIPGLSSAELMRFAADEGLALSSPSTWLEYGLALERSTESIGATFNSTVLPLVPQYTQDLEAFATRLERRLPQNA